MSWTLFILLAVMLFMHFGMHGMMGGHKGKGKNKGGSHLDRIPDSQKEVLDLQIRVADLIEQNHLLMREIQAMKQQSDTSRKSIELGKSKTSELAIHSESGI